MNTIPTIACNSTPIPYNNTATTLGVSHNRGMSFKPHTDNINTKAKTT